MAEKYQIFLDVADLLKSRFNIMPLLFGSIGLEKRTQTDLNAQDIDILIPQKLLIDDWNLLKNLMEEHGFLLYDLHEHAFKITGVSVAFASIESLTSFAGVDISLIPVITEQNTQYLLLALEDYLKVYTASSKDSYRTDKNNRKDFAKIELIKLKLGL